MKFWQYVVGSVLAALIFAAGFLSESSQLAPYLDIQFAKALLQETTTKEERNFTDTFFPNGEFLRVFQDTNISFVDEKRELFSGEAFIGGAFFSPESVAETLKNQPFALSNFGSLPNTLRIGPLLVHYRNSNIFASRDAVKKQSEIYAVGHSVDIWFDGRKTPFVLPSDTKLTVREGLIGPDTSTLFYTKLKKDFRMQSFELIGTDVGKNETPEQKILTALVRHRDWRKQFQNLAWDIPLLWDRGEKDSFQRKVGDFFYSSTIGIAQKKRDTFTFKNLVEPLVEARILAEDNKSSEKVEKRLKEFIPTFETAQWKSVLKEANLQNDWKSFSLAQKIWLPMISPESPAFRFFVLWELPRTTSLDKIEHLFTRAEILAANRYPDATEENPRELKNLWESTSFVPDDRVRVTRIRRLVLEMIRAHDFLHQAEFFALHESMIQTELSLYRDNVELQDELTLEIGQDLLSFLKTFLHSKTEKNVTQTLLQSWNNRNIDDIADKIGREIFTPEQKEVIEFIKLVGDSGLTPEELIAIKESEARQQELENATEELTEEDSISPETEVGIQGAKDLLQYLQEQNITLDLQQFKTDKEANITTFSGTIDEEPINGTFDYNAQIFATLTAFDATETDISPLLASKWIRSITPVQMEEVSPEETETFSTSVSQITPEAILSRRFLQTMLQSLGIEVERNDIGVMDEAQNIFEFRSAIYEDVLISGNYNKSESSFSNIEVEKGSEKIKMPDSIPDTMFIETLKDTVTKQWGSVWDNAK